MTFAFISVCFSGSRTSFVPSMASKAPRPSESARAAVWFSRTTIHNSERVARDVSGEAAGLAAWKSPVRKNAEPGSGVIPALLTLLHPETRREALTRRAIDAIKRIIFSRDILFPLFPCCFDIDSFSFGVAGRLHGDSIFRSLLTRDLKMDCGHPGVAGWERFPPFSRE